MRPVDLPAHLPDVCEFILQPKYDGWYIVFRNGRAFTRHGRDVTAWACWQGKPLPSNAVGELLHVAGRHGIQGLARSAAGMRVVLFDVPGPEPLDERLAKLPAIAALYGFEAAPAFTCADWYQANELRAELQASGHEGLVLKRRGSAWRSGDSPDWLRFKRPTHGRKP